MYFVYSFFFVTICFFFTFATKKMRKIKLLVAIFMIMVMGINVSIAQNTKEQVILQVCSSDNPYSTRPIGRSMQAASYLYLEGHKLLFDESVQPFTLYLYSGNILVYNQRGTR